jgi:hypothetical protein
MIPKRTVGLGASLVLLALVACSSTPPSTEKVQKTLAPALAEKFRGMVVKVEGIQADAQGNAATADLAFSHPWGRSRGTAKLSHYTDGRWVITDVHSDDGVVNMSGNLEIK